MWALGLVDPRTFRPQDKWFYQDKCDLGQLDPNPKNPQDRWALVLLDPRTVYPQYQWTLVPMGHSTTGPQYNWVQLSQGQTVLGFSCPRVFCTRVHQSQGPLVLFGVHQYWGPLVLVELGSNVLRFFCTRVYLSYRVENHLSQGLFVLVPTCSRVHLSQFVISNFELRGPLVLGFAYPKGHQSQGSLVLVSASLQTDK